MSRKGLEIWLEYQDCGDGFHLCETGFFYAEDLSEEGTDDGALSLEEDFLLTFQLKERSGSDADGELSGDLPF